MRNGIDRFVGTKTLDRITGFSGLTGLHYGIFAPDDFKLSVCSLEEIL
jgi:hypothetical protein